MGTLPLTEPVLLVLLSLAEQPRHGYSILKDVEHMSGGRVMLAGPCFRKRGFEAGAVVNGAAVVEPDALAKLVDEGYVVVSF